MLQKVIKIGNSAAITLSKQMLKSTKIKTGDKVYVELNEGTNSIIISSKEKPLKGMSPDIVQWTQKFINRNRQALVELADR